MHKIKYSFVLLTYMTVLPFMTGCVSTPVNDLKLVSIQPVVSTTQEELINISNFHEVIGGEKPKYQKPPVRTMLRISVSTNVLLEKMAEKDGVRNETYICGKENELVLIANPRVFRNGINISKPKPYNERSTDSPSKISTQSQERKTYYIYTYTSHVGHDFRHHNGVKEYYYKYDLKNKPESLCLRLGGGAYRSLGYETNIVEIPADIVGKALSKVAQE